MIITVLIINYIFFIVKLYYLPSNDPAPFQVSYAPPHATHLLNSALNAVLLLNRSVAPWLYGRSYELQFRLCSELFFFLLDVVYFAPNAASSESPELDVGPFLLIQSNPIRKYLVLNQTRILHATNYCLLLTFNRDKIKIEKRS